MFISKATIFNGQRINLKVAFGWSENGAFQSLQEYPLVISYSFALEHGEIIDLPMKRDDFPQLC